MISSLSASVAWTVKTTVFTGVSWKTYKQKNTLEHESWVFCVHVLVEESYLTDNEREDIVICKRRQIIILIENLHHDPVHTLQQQQNEKKKN